MFKIIAFSNEILQLKRDNFQMTTAHVNSLMAIRIRAPMIIMTTCTKSVQITALSPPTNDSKLSIILYYVALYYVALYYIL